MVDPASATEAMSAALDPLNRIIESLRPLRPESKSLVIHCPQSSAEVSILVRPGLRRHLLTNLKLGSPAVRRTQLFSLPELADLSYLVSRDDEGWFLDLAQLGSRCESAVLSMEYDIERDRLLQALVSTRSEADVRESSDEDTYWMHAALKHLAALETEYGSVDLRDLEVSVDVGVYERLKAALPRTFIRRIEALTELVSERDRNRRIPVMREYLRLARAKSSADDMRRLRDLQSLFTTGHFRQFVDVGRPFHYSAARPGRSGVAISELFDLPKFVEVAARTDLSLRRPAAEGTLTYKARQLRDYLASLL